MIPSKLNVAEEAQGKNQNMFEANFKLGGHVRFKPQFSMATRWSQNPQDRVLSRTDTSCGVVNQKSDCILHFQQISRNYIKDSCQNVNFRRLNIYFII